MAGTATVKFVEGEKTSTPKSSPFLPCMTLCHHAAASQVHPWKSSCGEDCMYLDLHQAQLEQTRHPPHCLSIVS